MENKVIALVGKGGVGKTSLSAVIVKVLAQHFPDKKILAIDADPAVGLATALGLEVETTVNDIRMEFIDQVESGNRQNAVESLGEAKFRLMDALVEKDNVSFLAIGRPESAGCYCKVNSYLKDVISYMSENFDYVVIDGEAGIEQVNRRVMEKVTHLLLVSDPSKKGLDVIKTIDDVAKELVMYDKAGVVINRVPENVDTSIIDTRGIELLTCIYNDSNLAEYDMLGKNVATLPDEALVVKGAKEALIKLGVITNA